MNTKKNTHKGFAKIDKLISQTAKQYNLETAGYKYQAIKYWGEVAGGFVDEASKLTQAVDFKKGVLTIACLSREVASKLRLLARNIIAALNQLLGKQVVYAIYVEV